jgi:hypothetical protein
MRITAYSMAFGLIGTIGSVYWGSQYYLHKGDLKIVQDQLSTLQGDHTTSYNSVIQLMAAFNMKLEPGTREALAHSIAAAVTQQLPTQAARDGFILVLGIESRFGQIRSKSPVGAVGMAQVMPQFASELADGCGLGKVAQADIDRDLVSLYLGACHFRHLYEQFEGNVALAQAAYNSGIGRTRSERQLPEETARYVARSAIIAGSVSRAEHVAKAAIISGGR